MTHAKQIKVVFDSVDVLNDNDWFGDGEWYFLAEVRQLPSGKVTKVGNKKIFEAKEGETIGIGWEQTLTLDPADKKIEIRLRAKDEDLLFDDDLGWVRITLNCPIVHDYDIRLRSNEEDYTARIRLEVTDWSASAPGKVTTIRGHFDANTYSTLHDGMMQRMVHVSPVIPVPWTTGLPPIPKGVQGLSASPQTDFGVRARHTKLNSLINPAVIPAIKPGSTGFADQVARIRVTQHRPHDLDPAKLIWKAATPNVRFWHGGAPVTEVKGGLEVQAYAMLGGDDDEEILIEVRWDGPHQPLLTRYRAWGGKIRYVWTRANIVRCSNTHSGGVRVLSNPTVTPTQVQSHILFSNVLLWQAGVQLAMDPDTTVYNGARAEVGFPGIFTVTSATNYTFNVPYTRTATPSAPLLNSRDGVFNLVYLHSVRGSPTLLGAATDRRPSAPEQMVSLGGSPSTSWVRPTGLWPDDDGKTVSMLRMGPSPARDSALSSVCGDGSISTLAACFLTNRVRRRIPAEVTFAHELGHVIGLHHRGSGGKQKKESYDKVNHKAGPRKGRGHPWDENLMTYGNDREAQDIDMIQAQVVRKHALMKDAPRPVKKKPKPTPPPPKPTPKKVPTAWTPTHADVELMQGYLAGVTFGLTHTGYDLGTTGPAGNGVDGSYGSRTRAAVRAFQKDHGNGLAVDGIYGPKTHDAFDVELNPPPEV